MFSSDNFTLPDTTDTHFPNCSGVTDDELAETVNGVWLSTNGIATINYVFSFPAFWWIGSPNISTFHLKYVDPYTVNVFQETVRAVIGEVVKRNNGIFILNEVKRGFLTDYSPFFRGIFYAQTASVAQFDSDGEGAFTVVRYDNNGFMKRAIINLPIDLEIYRDVNHEYQADWIEYAISHETYHGFCTEHLQNYPAILQILQNLPDGVFCSVMDYPNIIGTSISSCMQNCTPAFAIYPGALDIRSMQLAYLQGKWNHGYNKVSHFALNGIELCFLFMLIATAYHIIHDLVSYLPNCTRLDIPKKLTQTLLNLSLLVLFIQMDASKIVSILFGISIGAKMIPEKLLNRLPYYQESPVVKTIVDCKFPLYILYTSTIFAEGQNPLALLLAFLLSGCGAFAGTVVGRILALATAYSIYRQVLNCTAEQEQPVIEEVNANEVELGVVARDERPPIHPLSFVPPPQAVLGPRIQRPAAPPPEVTMGAVAAAGMSGNLRFFHQVLNPPAVASANPRGELAPRRRYVPVPYGR